jgi:hypothetical protein
MWPTCPVHPLKIGRVVVAGRGLLQAVLTAVTGSRGSCRCGLVTSRRQDHSLSNEINSRGNVRSAPGVSARHCSTLLNTSLGETHRPVVLPMQCTGCSAVLYYCSWVWWQEQPVVQLVRWRSLPVIQPGPQGLSNECIPGRRRLTGVAALWQSGR